MSSAQARPTARLSFPDASAYLRAQRFAVIVSLAAAPQRPCQRTSMPRWVVRRANRARHALQTEQDEQIVMFSWFPLGDCKEMVTRI
jgi:hypothetical protein